MTPAELLIHVSNRFAHLDSALPVNALCYRISEAQDGIVIEVFSLRTGTLLSLHSLENPPPNPKTFLFSIMLDQAWEECRLCAAQTASGHEGLPPTSPEGILS